VQNVTSQRAAASSGEPGVFERAPMAAGLVRITLISHNTFYHLISKIKRKNLFSLKFFL